MVGWYMDEMERIWKKEIVEVQSLIFLERLRKPTKSSLRITDVRPRFEPSTPSIQAYNITAAPSFSEEENQGMKKKEREKKK
jgi:hypothetical protein